MDIAEEYEALTQFLYLAPVGIVQLSTDGEILLLNPISSQLLMPLTRDGGLANLFTILGDVAPDLRYQATQFAPPQGMICDGVRVQIDAGVRGVRDPRVLSLSLLKLDNERMMALLSDVTTQVKRERMLRQNEAWFNAILTGIADYALISLDATGRVNEWNPSIGRVTGFAREQVVGQLYSRFYPDDATTHDRILDRLHEADANGWSMDDGWRVKSDGTRFWGSAVIVPLVDRDAATRTLAGPELGASVPSVEAIASLLESPDESRYCLIIRDITDKREATEQYRRDTQCDHLTGLANRRAFFEAAELELARFRRTPRRLSLILLDVDDFKGVNDRYGHAAGDALLQRLAAVLVGTFRQVDTIARVGGEEFAVLLPSAGIDAACGAAERMRLAVDAEAVEVDGEPIRVTVSVGVATMDGDLMEFGALMKRADSALYAAKSAGRNRVVVSAQPLAAAATAQG